MRIGQQSGPGGLFGPEQPVPKSPANTPSVVWPGGSMLEALGMLAPWNQDEAPPELTVRWHREAMPLAVHVEDNALRPLVMHTLRQWEQATEQRVRFRDLLGVAGADIVVAVSTETVRGRDYEVGHTRRQVSGRDSAGYGLIRHVDVTLIDKPAIDVRLDANGRKQRLIATILHEFGHALGLEHSDCQDDVMHHRGWRQTRLSANDCRRIVTLYDWERVLKA